MCILVSFAICAFAKPHKNIHKPNEPSRPSVADSRPLVVNFVDVPYTFSKVNLQNPQTPQTPNEPKRRHRRTHTGGFGSGGCGGGGGFGGN